MERVHSKFIRFYCCHECPVKYRKSYRLTKHLIEAHHLRWPNGHKRFRYKKDEDGCYRLQVVRYETLDEETIKPTEAPILKEKSYQIELTQSSPVPKLKVLKSFCLLKLSSRAACDCNEHLFDQEIVFLLYRYMKNQKTIQIRVVIRLQKLKQLTRSANQCRLFQIF